MKHGLIVGALAAIVFALAPASLAVARNTPAEVQKDYDAFILKFRAALKANDAAAVTQLTKFPFPAGEMRDAEYFRKTLYPRLFPQKVRSCLAKAKGVYDRAPNGEANYSLFCGEAIYLFTRTPEGFRFAETGAND